MLTALPTRTRRGTASPVTVDYAADALYRLVAGDGRERASAGQPRGADGAYFGSIPDATAVQT